MSVLNTFQYKQFLFILTLPQCNNLQTDLYNLQTRTKKIRRVVNGCKRGLR